jgi:hypothetical protein
LDAVDFAGGGAFFAGAFLAGAFLAVAICGEPPSTQVSLRCYRHSPPMWATTCVRLFTAVA